jgi:hypothetical protein
VTARALHALVELLRGFQTADEASDDLQHVYDGLLTVLLRLVFLLYAEDRGLLPRDQSLVGLFERLREDAGRDVDAMEQRDGAWDQLLGLFRSIFAARQGQLFDPDDYPFLEGRVSDGTIFRVLQSLLHLDGERISYRTLDVEELGSVYQSLMGFNIERAKGAAGTLYLQPGEERRRTGSHYTPRSLTQPIVQEALRPVLEELGPAPTEAQILALKVCDPAMGSGAFLIEACRQLADQLELSWERHGLERKSPDARRLVAEHCLYGVDKNPFAVNLAKLSLWLVTRAKDQPFTFLDHALKCGDSLIGLTRRQITEFCGEDRENARLQGDAVIAAFFGATKDKDRKKLRNEYRQKTGTELERVVAQLHERGIRPFHWELEFPEVFGEGFSVVIGNPPFLGGRYITSSFGSTYLRLLTTQYPGTSGGTDLSGFFFRRAFDSLAPNGTFGLIATNTISQGDTRAGGLEVILANGGTIYHARKRLPWPGAAAIIVSTVHVKKGRATTVTLDGRPVARISAMLMPSGPDTVPSKLQENRRKCFQGNIVLGEGFTFEDGNDKASSLAEMQKLLARDQQNALRIFPFIGGREVTEDPAHRPHRYVINFEELSEDEAKQWPALYRLLRRKVYPERARKDGVKYPRMVHEWWKFWNFRSDMYKVTRGMERTLVVPLIAKHMSMCFLPTQYVISHKLAAFAFDTCAAFCVLQSQVHECWTRFFSSTLGDGLNYSPTDCFETFPFPEGWQDNAALESAGQTYYEFRAELMLCNDEGLTKTYNRFHDPDERDGEIVKLRKLHAAMDRAVLEAYGWRELAERATCEFQLEYEQPEDRKVKKPWRYRWSQDFHDEVLARLLELNAQRVANPGMLGA